MLIADFTRYVLPDVPGCPSIRARQAVLDAAKEFLTFSGAWNEVQDPIPLVNGVNDYELEAPTGARLIDLRAVYAPFAHRGELVPVTLGQLREIFPKWQELTANLPSHYSRAFGFSSIRVVPMPTDVQGQSITMHAVYTLKDDAREIPDEIVERYQEGIAAGAKARLMRMAKVNWQDLPLSAVNQGLFDSAKLAAKVTAEHGKTKGVVTVPARAFR